MMPLELTLSTLFRISEAGAERNNSFPEKHNFIGILNIEYFEILFLIDQAYCQQAEDK
jgi:hypothetical protein